MAEKKPVCNYGGEVRELQSGDSLPGLGVGQSWQDVTAGRAAGTTYTNTTGRPICFLVSATASATSINIQIQVNNVVAGISDGAFGAGARISVMTIIPDGASYKFIASSGTLSSVVAYELR